MLSPRLDVGQQEPKGHYDQLPSQTCIFEDKFEVITENEINQDNCYRLLLDGR